MLTSKFSGATWQRDPSSSFVHVLLLAHLDCNIRLLVIIAPMGYTTVVSTPTFKSNDEEDVYILDVRH